MTLQTSPGVERGTAIETRAKAVKILREHYAHEAIDPGLSQPADQL